ncbi:MAG TPA: sialidase family protein [Spirochaetota bacterium]|nr:sialidase family protein [Spirochaetota bacterium]
MDKLHMLKSRKYFTALVCAVMIQVFFGSVRCGGGGGGSDAPAGDPGTSAAETGWHGVRCIESDGNTGRHTSIAITGNTIYIAYQKYIGVARYDLKITSSENGGESFSSVTVDGVANSNGYHTASTVDDDGNVYVSYYTQYSADNTGAVKCARLLSGNSDWLISTVQTMGVPTSPEFATSSITTDSWGVVFSGFYHWSSKELRFSRSFDNGATWVSPITVDSNIGAGMSNAIGIIENMGIHVILAYRQMVSGDNNDILKVTRSSDAGTSWDSGNTTTISNTDDYYDVSMAISSDGNIYVVSQGDAIGVHYSNDGGSNFTPLLSPGDGSNPRIAINDSGVIFIAYINNDGNLCLARSANNGGSWETVVVDSGNFDYNAIAVEGNIVCISYYDVANGDLKFARSIDGGLTW